MTDCSADTCDQSHPPMRERLAEGVEAQVGEMSKDRGRMMLSSLVRDHLGIDLDTFYKRLDAGDYDGCDDETTFRLVMLAPFGRA